MTRTTRLIASAAVGGLVLLSFDSAVVRAQAPHAITRVASLAPGSIHGTVQDERGLPVPGAMVSALGASSAVAVTDRSGRFELRTLSPGPYIVRAHSAGFVAARGQVVEVRPSTRVSWPIALRHIGTARSLPLLAGFGGLPESQPDGDGEASAADSAVDDDHGEVAWRIRHARRGILKDVVVPANLLGGEMPDTEGFGDSALPGRSGAHAGFASNVFATTPFSGQLNLLTTGSFDTPQQLFTTNNFSRSVAYLSVGAPAGGSADWTARAALTQGDIASWIVAGEYQTRAPARHRYDVGVAYSTQRYDGGNFAALRGVTDGSRNAGAIFAVDTFAIAPAVTLTYGARYAHYDYLKDRNLFSPRAVLTVQPADHFRISTTISRREVAPGAEEFMPRMDSAIWLPPQRTFSALLSGRALLPERTSHFEVDIERDIAPATVTVRAYRQKVSDQLATLFGVAMPGDPDAHLGHYFVHSSGDIETTGIGAGVRAAFARRVHGSVEYSITRAEWNKTDTAYLVLFSPSVARRDVERIHDLSTSVETDVPETATRVVVLYRLSNGFAQGLDGGRGADPASDRPLDARFDVQVRQSLPFMDFSTARWEMLLDVRNFFHDAAPDQSVYDELLVLRPPKRIVGGLTLKF